METLEPTEFTKIAFMTLTVFCLTVCSQSVVNPHDLPQVIVKTRANCNGTRSLNPHDPGFNLISSLKRYNCSRREKGFKCQTTFYVRDPFDLLGFQLCVDLQGVDDAIRTQTQLKVEVTAPGSEILKGVYASTHLDSPAYTCVPGSTLILTYGTRPTVRVCPTILDYLFRNTFSVGSVLLKQEMPVYNVHLGSCEQSRPPNKSSFIVKVYSPEYNPFQCPLFDRSIISLTDQKVRGCLSLVYLSDSYFCTVNVFLDARRGTKQLKLEVDRHFRDLPQEKQATICDDFDYSEDGDIVLDIRAQNSSCSGKFAVEVSFNPLRDDGPDDSSRLNSPRVFMAVFIALIIICLVCLALTCLCCIRFRTKRLRNARRRRRHAASTTNEAFDGPFATSPAYDRSISWNQTDPGMIVGLPSYEDVTGEGSAGVNPASDGAHKDDLPPSYDSIFAQETSGN